MPYRVEPFTFQFDTSLIEVDPGIFAVDCGSLYDAIKLAQASQEGIIYERIGKGSGLNELGQGVQVGLSIELLGNWQLKFEAGNYIARVAGGNLIGGPNGDPIAYSAGVQALLIQSANSTVVSVDGTSVWTEAQKNQVLNDTSTTRKFLKNRQKIENNILYVYDDDGTTVLESYDLKDNNGNATDTNVYEIIENA